MPRRATRSGQCRLFGLPSPMRILVDRSAVQEGEISIGSGVRYTTVIMGGEDLMRALGEVEVVELIQRDTLPSFLRSRK